MTHETGPAIYTEKQLGWAHKLGGAESLGISKVLGSNSVSQVDGFSDMAPACWLCGGEAFKKGNGLCLP